MCDVEEQLDAAEVSRGLLGAAAIITSVFTVYLCQTYTAEEPRRRSALRFVLSHFG